MEISSLLWKSHTLLRKISSLIPWSHISMWGHEVQTETLVLLVVEFFVSGRVRIFSEIPIWVG